MTDVHSKFGLQEKLRRTTTDNGSNFVKAFNQFSSKAETLPDLPVAAEVLDTDEADLMSEPALLQFLDEPESETFIPVEDILQQNEHVTILPKHMRCAAHTFNLVATADSERALEDLLYLEASTSAMKKARQLWNIQGRSTSSADVIKEELNRRLVVPNSTRWNSIFDSVVVLNSFLDEQVTRWVFINF
jgi:hypothetical protein